MKGNGKGQIISDNGAGQYSVKRLTDTTRTAAEITTLTAKISNLDTVKIPQFEAEVASAKTALNDAQAAINAAIVTGDQDAIKTATAAGREANARYIAAARTLANTKLERASAQKRLDYLAAYQPAEPTLITWCADHSEGLTGDVALIYPNNDPAKTPVIAPDGIAGTDATWTTADGQRQGAIASTPSGAWFNRAIQPAAQRNLATYRLATINAVDTVLDTADVTLDAAVGAQSINLNKTTTLAAIPVEYMTCNASAFHVGDRVVVRMDNNQENPTVIGFESNPRTCSKFRFRKVVWVRFAPQSVIQGATINHPDVSYAVREVRGTEIDVGVADWDAPGSGAAGDWDAEILAMLSSQKSVILGGRFVFLDTVAAAFNNFSTSFETKSELNQVAVERRSAWGAFTSPTGIFLLNNGEDIWPPAPGNGGYYSQPMLDFNTVDLLAGDVVWHDTWAEVNECWQGDCRVPSESLWYIHTGLGPFVNEQRIMQIGVSFEKYETA